MYETRAEGARAHVILIILSEQRGEQQGERCLSPTPTEAASASASASQSLELKEKEGRTGQYDSRLKDTVQSYCILKLESYRIPTAVAAGLGERAADMSGRKHTYIISVQYSIYLHVHCSINWL